MNLEKTFNKLLEQNKDYSTLTCFNIAIEGKHYGKMMIRKAFNKLVSADDYGIEDKDEIIEYCQDLTNEDKNINFYD